MCDLNLDGGGRHEKRVAEAMSLWPPTRRDEESQRAKPRGTGKLQAWELQAGARSQPREDLALPGAAVAKPGSLG